MNRNQPIINKSMANTKTFKNKAHQHKAMMAAKGKPRPNRMSKKKLEIKAKVEIVKEELLRQGYLEAIAPHLGKITAAHIAVAQKKNKTGTAERKLMFDNAGFKPDKAAEAVEGMGAILAEMFNMKE